jgi:hypothetical protein
MDQTDVQIAKNMERTLFHLLLVKKDFFIAKRLKVVIVDLEKNLLMENSLFAQIVVAELLLEMPNILKLISAFKKPPKELKFFWCMGRQQRIHVDVCVKQQKRLECSCEYDQSSKL